jgi:hypothetical protein
MAFGRESGNRCRCKMKRGVSFKRRIRRKIDATLLAYLNLTVLATDPL